MVIWMRSWSPMWVMCSGYCSPPPSPALRLMSAEAYRLFHAVKKLTAALVSGWHPGAVVHPDTQCPARGSTVIGPTRCTRCCGVWAAYCVGAPEIWARHHRSGRIGTRSFSGTLGAGRGRRARRRGPSGVSGNRGAPRSAAAAPHPPIPHCRCGHSTPTAASWSSAPLGICGALHRTSTRARPDGRTHHRSQCPAAVAGSTSCRQHLPVGEAHGARIQGGTPTPLTRPR